MMPTTKRDRTFFALLMCASILLMGVNVALKTLQRSLMEALMKGDAARAEKLLQRHITLDESSFQLALDKAASEGDAPIVLTILAYRPHLPLAQALCHAVQGTSPNMVKILLAHGADPNGHDRWGNTVLSCCLSAGEIASTSQSLSHTPSPGRETTAHGEILQLLRQAGAHLELFEAIRCGDARDIAWVLRHDIDPNADSDESLSALAYAYTCLKAHQSDEGAKRRYQESIHLLRACGAQCRFEETIRLGLSAELKRQLAEGADPNTRLFGGTPALYEAAVRGQTEIVRILLDHGAKIDAVTPRGKTALMTATARGHRDIVRLLMARKTPDEAAIQGRSPVLFGMR